MAVILKQMFLFFEDVQGEIQENKYCRCGGPEKEYVGFSSTIIICSICEKDKK